MSWALSLTGCFGAGGSCHAWRRLKVVEQRRTSPSFTLVPGVPSIGSYLEPVWYLASNVEGHCPPAGGQHVVLWLPLQSVGAARAGRHQAQSDGPGLLVFRQREPR